MRRNVFLDEIKSYGHVARQLDSLGREALKNGKAVGIGHVGQGGGVTARALECKISQMKKMGIEFVHLSEIVNQQKKMAGTQP